MSKLPGYSLVLIFFVALIRENIALRSNNRNSFQSNLNLCNVRCRSAFPPLPPLPSRRNEAAKCLILRDHNSINVGLCAAGCLERLREKLGLADICDCQNGKCIPSSTPAATSSTQPSTPSSSAAPPASSSPVPASSSNAPPASSSPAAPSSSSETPASSSPDSETNPPPTTAT